jgi:uncharacterized membrane protein
MSVLVGTDACSLAGLQGVGNSGLGSVPRLAVSGALGLALLSVAMLVFYVGHMTNAIRFDTIMRTVACRCRTVLARDHPLVVPDGSDPDAADATAIPERAMTLAAPDDRYLQDVDAGRLASLLAPGGLRMRLLPLVGTTWSRGSRSERCGARMAEHHPTPPSKRLPTRSCCSRSVFQSSTLVSISGG